MKRKDIIKIGLIIVLSIFLITITTNSFAQPKGKKGPEGGVKAGAKEPHPFTRNFDTNGDGKVSIKDEYTGQFPVDFFDLNGDGYIDAGEASKIPPPPGGKKGPKDGKVAAKDAKSEGLDSPMKVTLLGTGNPHPDPDRFGPSILVSAGEFFSLIAVEEQHYGCQNMAFHFQELPAFF
jgi:hypothetical protein